MFYQLEKYDMFFDELIIIKGVMFFQVSEGQFEVIVGWGVDVFLNKARFCQEGGRGY